MAVRNGMVEVVSEWLDGSEELPDGAYVVVRCRDCVLFDDDKNWCRRDSCIPIRNSVSPDGFCAWGVSRWGPRRAL